MNQKLLIGSLSLCMAFASISADARTYEYSGVACDQFLGSQNTIDRGQFGANNTSTTASVTVECPVDISHNPLAIPTHSVSGATIQAYDRNASTNVSCDLQKVDGSGNVLSTTNLQTSGSGATVKSVTAGLFITVSGTWRLRCSLPAISSGNVSHLVSYTVTTNE